MQQAPPAAADKNVPVEAFFPQTASTKKPSVSERNRAILPYGYQEFPVNIIVCKFYSNIKQQLKPKHKVEYRSVFQLSSMAGEHMLLSHTHNTLGTQCVYNIPPFL